MIVQRKILTLVLLLQHLLDNDDDECGIHDGGVDESILVPFVDILVVVVVVVIVIIVLVLDFPNEAMIDLFLSFDKKNEWTLYYSILLWSLLLL